MCLEFYTAHMRVIYREPNGILHATHIFRYKSSLRSNFLILKSKLHILQRRPIFSKQFWLLKSVLKSSLLQEEKGLQNCFKIIPVVLLFVYYCKGLRSAWLPLWA